jgi:hypothetical protein
MSNTLNVEVYSVTTPTHMFYSYTALKVALMHPDKWAAKTKTRLFEFVL